MFGGTGYDHGVDEGTEHARQGKLFRPRPMFVLSLVSKGYLDAYLKGYAKAYRTERSLIERLERDEVYTAEREERAKAKTTKARLKKRAEILKTQNNLRTKTQDDLER